MKKGLRAFTLVELIVVIVILGILSTIGFVSYNGYLGGARDSNRISQMKNINDALNLYASKNNLPTPDIYYSIFSTPGNLIGYQGTAGANVLEIINYTSGGEDPKDNTYYSYYLSSDRKRVQLLGYLEEADGLDAFHNPLVSQASAADYSLRFPKVYGKSLGILTISANKAPIQEDATFTTGEVVLSTAAGNYTAYLTDSVKLTGTGGQLKEMASNFSCERLRQTGNGVGDGNYDINPTGGATTFKAYCDMTTAGGGWTLISSIVSGSATHPKGPFGTQIVEPGINESASVPAGAFKDAISEMMACSSTNCWKWTMTAGMKTCLTGGCAATTDASVVTRVSGVSTLTTFTATQSLYSITANTATTLEIYNSATNGIGANAGNRRPMTGSGAVGTWVAGEKWEVYVR